MHKQHAAIQETFLGCKALAIGSIQKSEEPCCEVSDPKTYSELNHPPFKQHNSSPEQQHNNSVSCLMPAIPYRIW